MPTARPRALWFSAALLASVVATISADRPDAAAVETTASLVPVTCWSENFDAVTAPALPLEWSSATQAGASNLWAAVASGADTAPNRVATGNPATASDNALVSQIITPPPAPWTLSFRHSFNTEAGFDGGVLDISLNSGGGYTDILSSGGSFVAGAYNSTLSNSFGNPLGGRQAWSGNSGGFITTTITFNPPSVNEGIRLRWRMGTDNSNGAAGWSIDTITISADGCNNNGGPGRFSKIVPANNATLQPTSVNLVWAPSAGAASYEYCIDTSGNSTCNSSWISTGTATSVAPGGLNPGAFYSWHVRAVAPGGTTYANNSPNTYWSFTTAPAPPGAFTKISPLSGATNRPTTLTLNWTASAGASGYEYCIDKTDNGACGSAWESAGTSTSVTITNLDASTIHSWQVRAINVSGTTYADAGAAAFTPFKTAALSRVPVVDFDGNGSGDVFVQELSTGQWSMQRYQAGGGFNESGGGYGPNTSITMMKNDGDARTDGTLFYGVTGHWLRLKSTGTAWNNAGSGDWWPGWQRHVLDLDGDGVSDFFLYDPATGVWFQCQAGASPGGYNCYQGGWNPGWEIYPVRLNNDAFGDFFLIDRNTGRWFWALGTGPNSWNFTYPVTETWFSGWKIYPGDFNGDGLSDLLLHDPNTGGYFVASSTGSGFTYVQGGWAPAWRPIVADLNGDGMDDVFRTDPVTGNWTQMISDGAGGFTKVATGTWSLGWQIHPTDFNGDGKADFFLYHAGTGAWYQAINTGPGTFAYTSGTWKPALSISTGAIGR